MNINTDINANNYFCGTMVKGHDGLFYLSILDLEYALKTWVLDNSLEKSLEQKQAYMYFMDYIPVLTNYSIIKYNFDIFFCWMINYSPHSIEDRPFGKSQIPISEHLRYFRKNCENHRGYHKIVLSKEQYDCLLCILKV